MDEHRPASRPVPLRDGGSTVCEARLARCDQRDTPPAAANERAFRALRSAANATRAQRQELRPCPVPPPQRRAKTLKNGRVKVMKDAGVRGFGIPQTLTRPFCESFAGSRGLFQKPPEQGSGQSPENYRFPRSHPIRHSLFVKVFAGSRGLFQKPPERGSGLAPRTIGSRALIPSAIPFL